MNRSADNKVAPEAPGEPDNNALQSAHDDADVMPELTEAEHEDAKKRSSVRADVVHEAIAREGDDELHRSSQALAWSGITAGLSMGFSLVTEGLIRSHLPDAQWRPLVCKLGYSVGYIIVVLGRQQLFTENTLTVVLPLLARRNIATLVAVLRVWSVVLISNLIGALIIAYGLSHTAVFQPEVKQVFAAIGREAMVGDFLTVMIRGVFAGWLIALMVWLFPVAQSARLGVIVVITYVVGLGGFTHVIAGSVEVLYNVTSGAASWASYAIYVLPTLIGNILGGVALVAVLNHAQVVAGKDARQ